MQDLAIFDILSSMADSFDQAKVDSVRTQYLKGLFDKAVSGDLDAGDELSKIALGGFQQARDLIAKIEKGLSKSETEVLVK